MPKWSQPLGPLIGCKRRAASTAKESLMLKMLKVSNETVEATGEGYGVAIDQRSENQLSWGRTEPFQTQDAGIVTCSRLFLTHHFSLSRRAFFADPA